MRYLLYALCSIITVTASLRAENREFSSSDGALSLRVPAMLSRVEVESPTVVLALRHAQDGFPTFNIITEAGGYDAGRDESKQAAEVLKGYHSVGLSDTKVIQSGVSTLAGLPAFSAELEYVSMEQPYSALVHIIPAGDRHYVLTFLDRKQSFNQTRRLEREIVNSLEVRVNHATGALQDSSVAPVGIGLGLLAGTGLILALIFLLLFRWRANA